MNPYTPIDFLFKVPLRDVAIDSITLVGEAGEEPKEGPRGDRRIERNNEPKEAVFEPAPFTFRRDSADLLLWRLDSRWRPGCRYRLEILPDAFVDIYGHSNDTLKADFSIMAPDDYTEFTFKIVADSSRSYIVQLTDPKGDTKYSKAHTGPGDVVFDYVESGVAYRLRIIEDANGNGEWDGGDLVGRLFPERVAFFSDDAGQSLISTKANWNIVLTLDMAHIFDGAPTSVTNAITGPGQTSAQERELPVSDDEEDEL